MGHLPILRRLPSSHRKSQRFIIFLAQVYRKLGQRAEQTTELAIFEKLRRAQQGREQSARVVSPAGGEKGSEEFPTDPDVPKE